MKMQRQRTTSDRITWPASYSFLDVEDHGHARYLAGYADGLRDGRAQLVDDERTEAIHQAAAANVRAASDAIDQAEQRQRESEGLARTRQRWEQPVAGGGDAGGGDAA